MKKGNKIICSSCGEFNALYRLNCSNCSSFLRERVVNIDLWASIWGLFYAPVETFKKIVFAEHKNFIIFILILSGTKIFFHEVFFRKLLSEGEFEVANISLSLISSLISFIVIILLLALFNYYLYKISKSEIRYKDSLTILIYSFMPQLFSLFILAPVEYALFGKFWFTFNPSPFFIKETAAYMIVGIEGVLLLWSLLLMIFANYTVTGRKILSIIIALCEFLLLFSALFYLKFLF